MRSTSIQQWSGVLLVCILTVMPGATRAAENATKAGGDGAAASAKASAEKATTEKASVESPLPESAAMESTSAFNWKAFRVGALGASVGGLGLSSELLWAPTYRLNSTFLLRGSVGGTVLPTVFSSLFPVIDTEILLSFNPIWRLEVDAGGGIQFWVNNGGVIPVVKGTLQWVFENRKLWVIDRIYASYYRLLGSSLSGDMLALGVGIAF